MSLELLDKTRKIYRLLNRQESEKVDFNDFCRMLSQEMEVNVLLLSRKGKILGMRVRKDIPVIPQIQDINYGDYLQKDIHERILNILSTKENVNLLTLGFNFDQVQDYQTMVAPVNMAGKRLGTLFVYRRSGDSCPDYGCGSGLSVPGPLCPSPRGQCGPDGSDPAPF